MPKTVSASEAKNKLGSVVEWVLDNQDEVIVENHGEPSVVIISFAEYEKIKTLREQERRKQALARLENLREKVSARNKDLTEEEADALADRFARDVAAEMVEEDEAKHRP